MNRKLKAKGVWWDVANCPFPEEEFSLSRAKPCIESVLNKYLGPGPVTIHAMVDARNISRSKLKDLAASGMLIIHDEFATTSFHPLLKSWINQKPPPAQLLVLSDLPSSLYAKDFSKYGYELIHSRTRPAPLPREDGEVEWPWDWKKFLEKEIHDDEDLNHGYPHLDFYELPFLCLVCCFSAHNPQDFFDHLDSSFHREKKNSILSMESQPFITPEEFRSSEHRCAAAFRSDVEKLKGKGKGKGKKFVFDHRIPVSSCTECNYTFPHYFPHFRLRCSLCMMLVSVCDHCDLAKRDNYVCELCRKHG